MKMDDMKIQNIAVSSMKKSGGNQWRAYEFAKMELSQFYFGTWTDYQDALHRIADALKI